MKKWLFAFCFVGIACAETLNSPVMALYSTTNAVEREVAWSTRPGIRYVLQECSNLASNDWVTVAGFPSEAAALAQQHVITIDSSNRFFRVQALDEQAPKIMESYPADGDFGVGRFSSIRIELEDGVDTNSLSLTYGSNVYTLGSAELSFSTNHVLELDLGGDIALGYYGTTQTVSVAVSDLCGNSTNITWQFELEEQVVAASNLFIFGSPDAQRSGQQLSGVSATVAARFNGPVRMSVSANPWAIESVTSNAIVLAYTSSNAPVFEVGQKLSNLAPAHKDEIFYREVVSISDDPVSNLLTLGTSEILLVNLIQSGSFSLGNDDGVFLDFDSSGALVSAKGGDINVDKVITFDPMGKDFSGETLLKSDSCSVSLREGKFLLTPSMHLALLVDDWEVQSCSVKLQGDVDIACVPELEITSIYKASDSKKIWSKDKWFLHPGPPGGPPVLVQIDLSVTAKASAEVSAGVSFYSGFRQTGEIWAGGLYQINTGLSPDCGVDMDPLVKVPFTPEFNASAAASVSLIPQIDCRLYGCVGLYVNTDPTLGLSGSAQIVDGELADAQFRFMAKADINAGLSVLGLSNDDLPGFSPIPLLDKSWSYLYPERELSIGTQPQSQSAPLESKVTLSVEALGGDGHYEYQWFQNGKELPDEKSDSITLRDITYKHAGGYDVLIGSGSQIIMSDTAWLSVGGYGRTGGMVRIPGGTNSGTDPETGSYSLTVDTFYMDATEITKSQWDTVYYWAVDNGYSFGSEGWGRGPNHPVVGISGIDCLLWCNARSEKSGLTPCYLTLVYDFEGVEQKVLRTVEDGEFGIDVIVTNNTGFRLPTEVEWMYAARGGIRSARYPWGNFISHKKANYRSPNYYPCSLFGCDPDHDYICNYECAVCTPEQSCRCVCGEYGVDCTCGFFERHHMNEGPYYTSYNDSLSHNFHPVFYAGKYYADYDVDDDGEGIYASVGTAPVGSFSPNKYGLFDMIGNVEEIFWYSDSYFNGVSFGGMGGLFHNFPRSIGSSQESYFDDWRGFRTIKSP